MPTDFSWAISFFFALKPLAFERWSALLPEIKCSQDLLGGASVFLSRSLPCIFQIHATSRDLEKDACIILAWVNTSFTLGVWVSTQTIFCLQGTAKDRNSTLQGVNHLRTSFLGFIWYPFLKMFQTWKCRLHILDDGSCSGRSRSQYRWYSAVTEDIPLLVQWFLTHVRDQRQILKPLWPRCSIANVLNVTVTTRL